MVWVCASNFGGDMTRVFSWIVGWVVLGAPMRWIQGLGLDGVGRRGAELGSWRGWVDMELGGMNCFVLAPSVFFLGRQGGDEVSLLQMDASVVFQSEVAGGLGIATPPRKSRYFMSSKSHTRHRWETAFVQIQQSKAHMLFLQPRVGNELFPASNVKPSTQIHKTSERWGSAGRAERRSHAGRGWAAGRMEHHPGQADSRG